METKTIRNNCKLITGLSNQTVNLFQDESHPKKEKFRNKLQQVDPETQLQTASQARTIPVRVEQYNGKPRHIITDKHLRGILYPKKVEKLKPAHEKLSTPE